MLAFFFFLLLLTAGGDTSVAGYYHDGDQHTSVVKDLPKIQQVPKGTAVPLDKATDPSIVFNGPSTKALGRMAIIKVTFTGDDLKFDCNPKNDYWMLVKFFDDSVGIIFDAEKSGTFVFVAAVNGNGKTAVATYSIIITGDPLTPVIPPAPTDTLVQKLQQAYNTETGVGKSDHRISLVKAYQQGSTDFIPAAKTNADLAGMQKQLNEKLIGVGTLPQVRAVIAAETIATLGSSATATLDRTKATNLWNRIADALGKVVDR
jgi:hypothetical protein